MITILILAGIYALSFYGAYLFMQKAHYDEKGRWYNLSTTPADMFMTISPIFNTFFAIHYLWGMWKKDIENNKEITFFKPKK